MRRKLLALALLGGMVWPAGIEAQQLDAYLLRIEHTYQVLGFCSTYHGETVVLQNGLILSLWVSQRGSLTVSRKTATPEALAELRRALAANQVGFAVGGCRVSYFQPGEANGLTITWFGRAGRRHTFSVADHGAPDCPAGTNNLFFAIRAFLAAPGDSTSEELPYPPAPDCSLLAGASPQPGEVPPPR